MNRIYYNQADKRWANHSYSSSTYPKATIKSSGCGPTSASMVVSSFIGTIYPNEMADLFKKNGLRADTGTSHEAFSWIARKYGLKTKKSIYIKDAVEYLKKGGMVIACLKRKSLFADGGHIVVLSELRGNNLVVYDPYLYNNKFNIVYNGVDRRKGNVVVNGIEAIISVDNFKKYDDYTLYCYEAPIVEEKSKYSAGQAVEIDVPVQWTGTKEGNELQVDDKRGKPYSQYWINESVVNDKMHIYARATICNARGKEYMVQVFNRQFWIIEENIEKVLQ